MSTLDTLVIELVANTARLQGDMNKASGIVSDSMKKVEGAVNFAKQAFVALGGAATLAGIVNLVKGSIDAAEALHDLSISTGASVEALSAMSEIGKYTGVTLQDVGGMMSKLAKNTAGVTSESAAAAKALAAIGISVEDFRKLKPEDQMMLLAKTLNQYADGAEKAQVAQALLGKGAERYLPFLKDMAVQGKLNATVTTAQAAEADKFNDRVTELKATFEKVVRTLSLDLLPVLSKLLEGMGAAIKIFTAYMVLMVGLPAAVNAVSLAIKAKATAMAAASAAAEMGIVANTGYVASMKAMIVQAGLLQTAFGVLFAFIAGWQIGKYLRENFLEAQLAGIAFVEGTLVAWERLKYGLKVAWEYIAASGKVALDALSATFAIMLDGIGRGLKALGAEDVGGSLTALAARLKEGATASTHLELAVVGLRAEMDKNVASIREVTGAMADDAIASFQVTKEVEKQKVAIAALSEENVKAAAASKKAADEKLENIRVTSQYMLEEVEVTAKYIEVAKQATGATDEWQKAIDSVFDGLTDALFRAFEEGKGFLMAFRDTLVNAFKTLVLQPTIQAIMRPVAGVMGGLMSGVGSAVAGTPGAAGGGGGMLSTLGTLGGLTGMGSMLGSGLGFGLIGGFGGGMGLAGTMGAGASMISGGLAGGMAGLGSTIAGIGAMVGAALPVIAAVYAIWKGFSRGPKKITEQGISGTIVGGDATAQLYEKWKQSGGWIVGDRKGTRYKDLSEEMSAGLDQATAGVYGQMAEWTKAIGLPAEKLAEVTHSISIKLGKDDAETQKNIEAAMAGYQAALAGKFAAALEPFRNAGDTLVETLQRLVGIQAMSESLNQFGGVFSRIAQLSIDAREELIGFAGGIEALIQKAGAFVGAYYSESEQAGISARPILEALKSLGIGDAGAYSTKAEFRALIEGIDISTTAGRKTFDMLLSIAPSFAQVADYIAKAGGTLGSLADQAPQAAVLEAMFAESQAANEYAEQTASGVAAVETAVTMSGDNIVAALDALRVDLGGRLVAVEDAVLQNSRNVVGAIEAMP